MRVSYRVKGMTCVNCARTIEIALKKREGVRNVKVSFELGKVDVEFDENKITENEIKRTITELGYKVEEEENFKNELFILLFSILSSSGILFLMFFPFKYGIYVQLVLSTLVQLIGGWKFYRGACNSLKNGVANMDVLVSLGTTGAYLYSVLVLAGIIPGKPFFETNAFLISFVRLGRFIEEVSKRKALRKLRELLSAPYSEVNVIENGKEVRKNVKEVFKGETIVCRKGDIILLDGEVIKGEGYVSEAVITGEPEPVPKKIGDRVISGSTVEDGVLYIKVLSSYENSFLSKLNRLVDSALSEKPEVQRLADKVSHYFVQFVILLSVIVFSVWFYLTGDIQKAVQFSLAVLVISCPCAFGIAVPLAVATGISKFLEKGILIKKPSIIEIIPKINMMVFDKTGTITEGKFRVKEFKAFSEDALDIAYTMESVSNHPVARSIREFARSRGAKEVNLKGCKEIIGKGIVCGEFFIGSDGNVKGCSKSVVLKKKDKILAIFCLEDTLREEAKRVIEEIKSLGIKIFLLSGDREEITQKVAKELGFDEFKGGVSPEEKLKVIEELQKKGFKVSMVGDGINDAPALAKADLSVAIAQGSDITKQVGDVILLSGISSLPHVFKIGILTVRKIKQNIAWAFVYNIMGIPVAGGLLYKFGIVLKPEIAGLMMALSSLSVVLNTLTMKLKK